MTIHVNEQQQDLLPGDTVGAIRDRVKPQADLLIVNGFPAEPDAVLQHGDHVVLIRRGEIPAADEFEALLTARHTPGVHQHIKHACIGIAGVGGLGSSVAIALARIGVGQLILADFDVVEPSNLNRQQYFIDQIGQPKVYALRTTLMR
ncbi:MAG: ThiF family adenylyltransferase, partial [Deltaproteobacteria bacterium]|nr:ThiF family adenylyltransferase [Deltaproteobacteria bacterium]